MLPDLEQIKPTAKIFKKGEVQAKPFLFGNSQPPEVPNEEHQFSSHWLAADPVPQPDHIEDESVSDGENVATELDIDNTIEDSEPEIPKITLEEHDEIVLRIKSEAFEAGKKEAQKTAERSQTMSLITEVQNLAESVALEQDKQLEGFRAVSQDTSKALTAVLEKLMPQIKERGFSHHIADVIAKVFSNASPDLEVSLIAHPSDKISIERALEAINPEDRRKMTLKAGSVRQGTVELRWPDSSLVFDWDNLQQELIQKLQEAFMTLATEFEQPAHSHKKVLTSNAS